MPDQVQHKTILGADCRITGELSLDNDAVIMGQFKGTLRVRGVLELTESSRVQGTVVAGAARLGGTAEADVIAEQGAELLPTAKLTGQIYSTHLNIMEGAVFQGDVQVGPKALEAAAALLAETRDGQGSASEEAEAGPQGSGSTLVFQGVGETGGPEASVSVSESLESLLSRRRPKILTSAAGKKPLGAGLAAKVPVQAKAS